jgi:uncharacterized protein (DUF1786 family)
VSIRGDSHSAHGHKGRRLLAVDVGAGTTDVLVWQEGRQPENSEKLVAPSATVVAGRRIEDATRRRARVVFRGPTMGGVACTVAARRHLAAGCDFLATETAAFTFADDLRKVGGWGVRLVGEDEAQAAVRAGADEVRSGDVDAGALLGALERLGVDVGFSAVAVAVQDHGFNPAGSNRVFRFETWRRAIAAALPLASLFYDGDAVPAELTRLRAAAGCFAGMHVPLLAGDTGPAALLGVAPEDGGDATLVNIGNGHTIVAVSMGGRLAGVLEHHTGSLDGARRPAHLRDRAQSRSAARQRSAADLPGAFRRHDDGRSRRPVARLPGSAGLRPRPDSPSHTRCSPDDSRRAPARSRVSETRERLREAGACPGRRPWRAGR